MNLESEAPSNRAPFSGRASLIARGDAAHGREGRLEARDHVATPGEGLEDPRLNAVLREDFLDVARRDDLVARRVRRVEAEESLEVLDGLVLELLGGLVH